MVRLNPERILLIGDATRQLEPAIAQAAPAATVVRAESVFDGLAELAFERYAAVVVNAEPIERRPEAAVRALRDVAGEGRVILFGHPTLEPVSRKMLEFGCDDYVVTPPSVTDLQRVFGTPVMRIARPPVDEAKDGDHSDSDGAAAPAEVATEPTSFLDAVPLADIGLEAMVHFPGAAAAAAVKSINHVLGPRYQLTYSPASKGAADAEDGHGITLPVRVGTELVGHLRLALPADAAEDDAAARHFLSRAVATFGQLTTLQERHNRLTKLATTDQLTGVFNRRYFEHFLAGVLEKAKQKRFQVTLLLFDIDNFKRYNDECGHGMGDEILRETAAMMRRCCREHDFVARIGGDEFAVVFWEKEGPRQPKDPSAGATAAPARLPQEPVQILKRFRKMVSTREFAGLGPDARGTLTISGGLASFPWDGRTVEELVEAADHALTFGAKKGGKNSIHLVGGDAQMWEDDVSGGEK